MCYGEACDKATGLKEPSQRKVDCYGKYELLAISAWSDSVRAETRFCSVMFLSAFNMYTSISINSIFCQSQGYKLLCYVPDFSIAYLLISSTSNIFGVVTREHHFPSP